jgi:hypothetical protein
MADRHTLVRSEVFTAVTMKNAFFWDVAPCRFCVNRRFGGSYCLHLQGRRISEWGINVFHSHRNTLAPRSRVFLPWRWRRYVLAKRLFTQDLHGATSQKRALSFGSVQISWANSNTVPSNMITFLQMFKYSSFVIFLLFHHIVYDFCNGENVIFFENYLIYFLEYVFFFPWQPIVKIM